MKYDIPLIFYGENESEYGNPIDDNDSSLRSEKYYTYETFDDIFLVISISDLNNKFKVKEIVKPVFAFKIFRSKSKQS